MIGEYREQEKKLFAQRLWEESATQKERVGTLRRLDDGRIFAYARAGAVALVAGNLNQSSVPAANHKDIAPTVAVAIGAQSLTVQLGATAAVVNEYKDGWMHVNDDVGEGHLYKVRAHPAAISAATLAVSLYDKIRVALTIGATSTITLTKNGYRDLIIQPSPNTARIMGVTPFAVTALYYFWLQIEGICPVLTDGTVVIGQHVRASDGVDGAVEALDRDGTAEEEQACGTVVSVNVDTEYSLIDLCLQ